MAFSISLESYSLEKLIIIGGGVAGLSCMNALLDLKESPLLLEERYIGSPKLCGEFIAPEANQQLERWGIGPIQKIKQVQFNFANQKLTLSFKQHAGGFSRTQAEYDLAQRAIHKGGRIQEQSKIKNIEPPGTHSCYVITLESGLQLQAQNVIIATGKIPGDSEKRGTGILSGFKIHIPHILDPHTLNMFTVSGAYFGIVPITPNTSNLTCLATTKVIKQYHSCRNFLYSIMNENPLLESIHHSIALESITILEGHAAHFNKKTLPKWPNAFWIGDALTSFHPAIGYGFAHGIQSALSAAHHFKHADANRYLHTMKQTIRNKIYLGKALHHMLIKPSLNKPLKYLFQSQPRLIYYFMKRVGY